MPVTGFRAITLAALVAFSRISLVAVEPVFTPIPNFRGGNPVAISEGGTIIGAYYDEASQASHNFILKPSGAFISFDPIHATGVNDHGDAVGYSAQSFWRQPDGTMNLIQHPGAAWTSVRDINNYGDIVGEYSDYTGRFGFIGFADGTFVSKIPGLPLNLNDNKEVVGYFSQTDPARFYGFILSSRGAAVISIPPTPGISTKANAFALGINNAGEVIGNWNNIYEGSVFPIPNPAPYLSHGFYRGTDGKIIIIDYPGARETFLAGIDGAGRILGSYRDTANQQHSFLCFLK